MNSEKSRGSPILPVALLLGAVTGGIVWLFLKLLEVGTFFLWETLPSWFEFNFYPLAICLLGGVLIGLWRKKFGAYPEEFESVIELVKKTKRYDSRLVSVLIVSSILPLMFGGSVGPEAGLVGITAALCTWVGDRFKHVHKEMSSITQVGISASLSTLFTAPLFGFLTQVEGENQDNAFPGRSKMIVYFSAIFSGIGMLFLLTSLFGGGMAFERFGEAQVGEYEMLLFLPFALVGVIAGNVFNLADKLIGNLTKSFEGAPFTGALIGGLLLGVCGIVIPLVMFSGEEQMFELSETWLIITPAMLMLTGLVKLLLINICVHTGWRGGHIIPIIFAGACFGYAAAAFTGANEIFAVAAVTSALCGAVMRKPLAVIMVLLIFFPMKNIIVLSLAAFIGAFLTFKENQKNEK
ncbi:MAG: chloride channel protein [Oscillospiraceae bacterium]|nr:chloride channel protein [Oscillospiraceae bacterium]